jgi:hypothetical protein
MALYFAFGWLAVLVFAANASVPAPDGFGLAILALTFWSLGYLYYRLCRRWPVVGWLGLGLLAGLFGGGYHSHTTTFVEREYDDVECDTHDSCDGDA